MPDVEQQQVAAVLGRSLLTAEVLASELRDRIVEEVLRERGVLSDAAILGLVRDIAEDVDPVLVQAMTDAEVAAWVAGGTSVRNILPAFVRRSVEAPPVPPPNLDVLLGGGDEPLLRFPLIDRAAADLVERNVVTREQFGQMGREARSRAFTVARLDTEDAVATVRDVMAESVREGTSLSDFRNRLEERLEGSRLGPAHLENVYRTNVQAAFHRGHDELASNPIVEAVFPYQEYLAINDGRVRDDHLALESLGLSGTNIYRRDDPFWDLFTPPWDYQCRCGVNLLTVEAAARKGVVEARRWERTGVPPTSPEWRINDIPFRPPAGFQGPRRLVA